MAILRPTPDLVVIRERLAQLIEPLAFDRDVCNQGFYLSFQFALLFGAPRRPSAKPFCTVQKVTTPSFQPTRYNDRSATMPCFTQAF